MLYAIFNIVEILFVNLFHTHIIARKKYSNQIVLAILFTVSFALLAILYFANGINEESTVRSVLVGFIYLVPLYFLYDLSFKKLLTIMIYCWTYTIIISTVAYGVVSMIDTSNTIAVIFSLQSLFILVSIIFVFTFSKKIFKKVLDKASDITQNLLLVLSISIFSGFVGIRYFVDPNETIYLVLTVIMIVITITSYALIFSIVQANINLTSTKKIAYKDSLTGVKNRYSLFQDIDDLISNDKSFSVLFLDLDDFKSINDKYSHMIGDIYLMEFTGVLVNTIKDNGSVYRFAGDEFVCLITKKYDSSNIKELELNIKQESKKIDKFNGVSIGSSFFPENGLSADELLNSADKAMYGKKKSRKIRRI
jgi:diguanylate cyclase (GGDEF)-like protein